MMENVPGMGRAALPGGAERVPDQVLQSVVTVARAVFEAAAVSILLLDGTGSDLVFEAVAGEGEQELVGQAFPADRGIAGWVAATGEAMIVDDLTANAVFARDVAESTGFVPSSIMAAPVSHQGAVRGVLEVLDPAPRSRSSLTDLDLLTLLAGHAGTVVSRLERERTARSAAMAVAGDADFERLAGIVQGWDPVRRAAAGRLIADVAAVLGLTSTG